jgi:mannosyltransferase OCH1-like enzyme
MTLIPKVIHQIWIGDLPAPGRWMATWRERHPSWEYRLWTDASLADLPAAVRERVGAIPEVCGRADVIRWHLLHRHGGVFVDADSECLRPLPEGLLADRFFSCWENERCRPGLVACGFMGAVPGSALVGAVLAAAVGAPLTGEPAWLQFGPGLLTRALRAHPWPGVRIHPSHYFLPEHFEGYRYTGEGPVYARHYWGSTLGYGGRGGAG